MRARTCFLTFVFWALAVVTASSQELDITKLAPGTLVRWQADNGNTSVEYLGPDGDDYALIFERDASQGEPARLKLWSDRRGEMTRIEDEGGVTTFKPTDCSLTIGDCTYVETRPDGAHRKMYWHAEVSKKGVWTYQLFRNRVSQQTLIESGQFTVDKYGFYLNHTYSQGQMKRWGKRIH